MGLRLSLLDDDVDHTRDNVVIAEGDVHELHAQLLKLVQRHLHDDDHDAAKQNKTKTTRNETKQTETKSKSKTDDYEGVGGVEQEGSSSEATAETQCTTSTVCRHARQPCTNCRGHKSPQLLFSILDSRSEYVLHVYQIQ